MTPSFARPFLLALFAWLPLQALAVSDVVISQVYGGNGSSFNRDFVELYNRGSAPVNITGWSIQYASATGTGNFSSNPVTAVSGTLAPGQYYLVGMATATGGTALPTPDATGTVNLSSTAGKVVLVNSTTGLACNGSTAQPCTATQLAAIVDLVGYGSANFFEGAGAAPAPTATSAVRRLGGGCADTDNNSADFAVDTAVPRNSSTVVAACTPGQPVVPACPAFSTVQGIAGSSAITATDGDDVVTAAAITSGGVPGITLGTVTPAATPGGTARVRVEVAASLATGSYAPVVTFTNASSQTATCTVVVSVLTPPGSLTSIPAIQGPGATSPITGSTVTTRGVVTGAFPGLRGYFIQDETGDGNPLTSDGLFVFSGSTTLPVEVGERVQVTGPVVEFAGDPSRPTITEIGAPSTVAKLGLGSIVPTPVTLPEATEGDLERFEGMLVTIPATLTVSQNFFQGRYGQVTLSAAGRLLKPTNVHRPGTPDALALAADNARRRIVLDDGRSSESLFSGVENPNPIPYIGADNTLRAGDTVTGLTGIVDYGRITSATGATSITDYKLHPTVTPVFVRTNPRTAAPPAVGGNIRVASFNVLNFFTTFGNGATASGQTGQGCLPSGTTGDCRGADSAAEFTRQRDKIVRALAALDADVVGLIEIQRNGGVATQNLVGALNGFLGSAVYAAVPDPAFVGTDAIQQTFIYKPARVSLVGSALSDASAVHNRPPVAQVFAAVAGGGRFSVVVNHFKSKNCDGATGADLDQGDGQGCFNDRRRQQATALLSFVNSVKLAAGDDDVVVVGDLNAYGREDPVDILVNGGLQDQLARFGGGGAYSYVFDGEAGYLDHGLVTTSMIAQVTGATTWAINADEPSIIDYNTEFKPQDLYTASPYRSSDHDPVLLGVQLSPPPQPQTISFGPLPDRNLGGGAFTLSATATSGLAVSFSTSSAACSVSGTTVTLLTTGVCAIDADQAGNALWTAAPRVTRSFTVLPALLPQTIGFDPLPDRPLSAGTVALTATASSGLAVSYASSTAGVCSVSGSVVTLVAAGTCTVVASQPGNTVYAAAATVERSFQVTGGSGGGPGGSGSHNVPMPAWAQALLLVLLAGVALRTGIRRQLP